LFLLLCARGAIWCGGGRKGARKSEGGVSERERKKGIVGGGEDGRWRLGVEEMERE
jgi:hypothetical protein